MSGLKKGIEVHKTPFSVLVKDSNSEDEGWEKASASSSKKRESKPSHSTGGGQPTQSKASAKNARRRAKKRQSKQAAASETLTDEVHAHENGTVDECLQNEAWAEEEFQKDLGEAIMQSMLDAEKQQAQVQDTVSETRPQKTKKNKKGVVLSLQELHNNIDVHPETQSHPETQATSVTSATPPSDFFNQLDADVRSELKKETVQSRAQDKQKINKPDSSGNGLDFVKLAQLTSDLEKKDREVKELTSKNKELESQLKEVTMRNQILHKWLSRGEISGKSDLLQEIEHITSIKDELTDEVKRLHTELEQEKSKNKLLQLEMGKLQEAKKAH